MSTRVQVLEFTQWLLSLCFQYFFWFHVILLETESHSFKQQRNHSLSQKWLRCNYVELNKSHKITSFLSFCSSTVSIIHMHTTVNIWLFMDRLYITLDNNSGFSKEFYEIPYWPEYKTLMSTIFCTLDYSNAEFRSLCLVTKKH